MFYTAELHVSAMGGLNTTLDSIRGFPDFTTGVMLVAGMNPGSKPISQRTVLIYFNFFI